MFKKKKIFTWLDFLSYFCFSSTREGKTSRVLWRPIRENAVENMFNQ